MELKSFIQGCFQQHYNAMIRSVNGLSPEEMAWTPNEQCSSIAFLVWHYGRTADRWLHNRIKDEDQAWEQGWAGKLGWASADPSDTGFSYSVEQLRGFKAPDTGALLEYVALVRQESIDYLESLTETDFDEITLPNPRGGTISLGVMFQQLIWEFNQHGGQIAYLRGEQRGLQDPGYSGGLLESLAEESKG